jgi:hypothetical protein
VAKRGRRKARAKDWVWLSVRGREICFEEARALTDDELKVLYQELTEWRRAQPAAPPVSVVQPDSMGWLATLTQGPEFKQPAAMSPQLWDKLINHIRWQVLPLFQWTQDEKDQLRWKCLRWTLDHGHPWGAAEEEASKLLRGTQAEARPETVKVSYQKIEKSLPPEKRRPRTYRPRS